MLPAYDLSHLDQGCFLTETVQVKDVADACRLGRER